MQDTKAMKLLDIAFGTENRPAMTGISRPFWHQWDFATPSTQVNFKNIKNK